MIFLKVGKSILVMGEQRITSCMFLTDHYFMGSYRIYSHVMSEKHWYELFLF